LSVVELGADNARGNPAARVVARIKALREARLRAEHMAFSFMKRRVQPLMARDTLGYEYTGDDNTSWMPGDEVVNDDIVDSLTRIFKDMLAYTPCPVPEFSAAHPPKEVSSRIHSRVLIRKSSRTDELFLQDDLKKFVSEPPPPPQLVEVPEEGKATAKERHEVGEGDDTIVVEDTSEEDDDEETLQDRF
jgi:hypothetical protein